MLKVEDLLKLGKEALQKGLALAKDVRSEKFFQCSPKTRMAWIFEMNQCHKLYSLLLKSKPFSKFDEEEGQILKSLSIEDCSSCENLKSIYKFLQDTPLNLIFATEAQIQAITQFLDQKGLSHLSAKLEWPMMTKWLKKPSTELQYEMFQSIRSYLASHWEHEKIGYFSYTKNPYRPSTNLHVALAELLYDASMKYPDVYRLDQDELKSLSLIRYLMPGLKTESIVDGYGDLSPKDKESMSKILKTHIISQNGFYLIPVNVIKSLLMHQKKSLDDGEHPAKRALLSPPTDPIVPLDALDIGDIYQIPNPYYDYTLDSGDNQPYLTTDEVLRLKSFSKQTTELFTLYEQYHEIINRKTHLLGQCRILAERLLQNGKNGHGVIEEAGAGAEAAIHAFLDYYEKLTVDETHIPPLLRREISFLRRCVRRCHPDDPVLSYAETCTDAAYQRIIAAISGHEATLIDIVLDDTSENYQQMITNIKEKLVEYIRSLNLETTEPKSIFYDQIMVSTWNFIDIIEKLKKIYHQTQASNPNAFEFFVESILTPQKNLEALIKSLLDFNETELQKFSENMEISKGLISLFEHYIHSTDDWSRLLTFISPAKIKTLHSPEAIVKIMTNINQTRRIPFKDAMMNLLGLLTEIKREILVKSLQSASAAIIREIPQRQAHMTFNQKQIEALNELLPFINAPASESYQLLQIKIKSFCDNPDYARLAELTREDTILIQSILEQYHDPRRFVIELKPYFEKIDKQKLSLTCAILLKFKMPLVIKELFNQSIVNNIISNPPTRYASELRQRFYQFLYTINKELDDQQVNEFMEIFQATAQDWIRYITQPSDARSIEQLFPRHKETLSSILYKKFDNTVLQNTSQMKQCLLRLSESELNTYLDQHGEKTIQTIDTVPDFINIYDGIEKIPQRREALLISMADKFCTITKTYKHISLMALNLLPHHLKTYLDNLEPQFLEKMLCTNTMGEKKNLMSHNLACILKKLSRTNQSVLIKFLFEKPSIKTYFIENPSEIDSLKKEISKHLKGGNPSIFETYISSLKLTMTSSFTFFRQSMSTDRAEARMDEGTSVQMSDAVAGPGFVEPGPATPCAPSNSQGCG